MEYDTLADVYAFLVPDALQSPEGSVAAFADALADLPAGARVLDCAAGTGQLAVGLALRGCEVVATDASPAMIERTRALAEERGAHVEAFPCRWEDLDAHPWARPFDAVLCVGNSLTHAAGRAARGAALRAMAACLRPGGRLVVTSRDWEQIRAAGSRLEVEDELVERDGRRGLVIRHWTIPPGWEEEHRLDVAVALLDDASGAVETHAERLTFHPFTRDELLADLRAAGLEPTHATRGDRHLVTAARSA